MLSNLEASAFERLMSLALVEDLQGPQRTTFLDMTSQAVIPPSLEGSAVFVARAPGVIAGLPAVEMVFQNVATRLPFRPLVEDGSRVNRGDRVATVAGSMRGILAGERVALNFLQHLSGVASLTRQYVDAITGCRCAILDTRKTLPAWRVLEKYAVRQGGGRNHRMGLYDGVLIKDNHLAALWRHANPIAEAVRVAREQWGSEVPVEIEVDTLEQLDAALACGPDIVLLDNMTTDQMREAVRRRNAAAPQVQLEASGGVNLDTVRGIAETGVDRISVGALTHSAPALDIALDYEPA